MFIFPEKHWKKFFFVFISPPFSPGSAPFCFPFRVSPARNPLCSKFGLPAEEEEGDDDDDDDNDADVSMRNGGSGSNSGPHIGHLASSPLGGTAPPVWAKSTGGEAGLPEGFVTLRVQNVEFEMMLRPVCLGVMHTVAAVRVGRALPSCHCT